MKKYLLFLLFCAQLSIYGQPYLKEKVITYETVIKKLKETYKIKNLENKFNYTFILLLDSTNIDLIKKIDYQYIDDFRSYAQGLPLSNQTVGFVTDKKDIKNIFEDNISLKRILIVLKDNNIPDVSINDFNYPIYIKGNKAIFEISGPTWSDTYFATLNNGVLQINWLGGIIE